MRFVFLACGLLSLLTRTVVADQPDRLSQVKKLIAEYAAAEKEFFHTEWPTAPTAADSIRRYEVWPGWSFLPRFVKLAEAKPDDQAAFLCCQWIVERTRNVGNEDRGIFDADQKAWTMLESSPLSPPEFQVLSLTASLRTGSARERFLRGVIHRHDVSRETRGVATLALGQFFVQKYETIESREYSPALTGFDKYVEGRKAANWGSDLVTANGSKFKGEALRLFREVLARYADVRPTIPLGKYPRIRNLGDKATKSVHALEHLTIGSPAPRIVGKDLHGRPLDLSAYQGRFVILTFWFSGCGPCMGMIPQERRLIQKYQGRSFALLSVCTDESLTTARKTAAEHQMDWPCWFDGADGPIARDWNVRGYPTIYILDKRGVIVAKRLRDEPLDTKIAELMDSKL